ncbi:proteasome subunit beta [Promethearchaeum syntrophicum]|uniref:proteasome endopeptidase complex n=1 Tax=Promethearchaeum syntrophicum TaxID=2594042 RepID=A0A5B9D5X4_9ARCH|nr:proteasome subunit beta [Candidatus Prometheoarchaeum syntrophicum]QEE14220.1 Proteasome subunit beta precursor [Candidatus Prometheoarchaeum syntrophicum]
MSFKNPTLHDAQSNPEMHKLEMLKTGTTTIGMVIKDGVILATESQATAGYFVANKKAQKLFKINNQCGATIAGGVSDCQYVVGQAQAISRLLNVRDEKEPSLEYIANIVRNILFNGRSFFQAFMIIGGYDSKTQSGRIFPIDFLGYMADSENFASLGSGSTFALGVMEGSWKPEMSVEEGVKLVEKALSASKSLDIGSGSKNQIVVITKDKFEVVEGPITKI